MTRFRLFILLTYTAARVPPIQRCNALSPLLSTENQFFLLVRGMMVTNPSSFVNSSRERSLSSTSSYPSLRCNLRICCSPCPRWYPSSRETNGMRARTHTYISDGTHYLWALRYDPFRSIFLLFSYPSSSSSVDLFCRRFPLSCFLHTYALRRLFLRRSLVVGLKGVFSSSTSLYSFPSGLSPASQHNRGDSGEGTTGDPLRGSVVLRSRREASNSNFRCITRSCRTAEVERTKQPMLHHRFTRRRQKHKP